MKQGWTLAAMLLACGHAAAQSPAAPSAPSTAPMTPPAGAPPAVASPLAAAAASDGTRLPAGTPVTITLEEAVASNSRVRGNLFAIKLAAPIVIDGRVVAPAGALGQGEVVYAEPGGAGGAPGKLVLAARYIDVGAVHIRLKAFSLAAGGEANFREMQVAAEFLGPAVMFVNGRNVLYPVGTRARAKVAEDVVFPAEPAIAPSPAAAPASAPANSSTAAQEPKT